MNTLQIARMRPATTTYIHFMSPLPHRPISLECSLYTNLKVASGNDFPPGSTRQKRLVEDFLQSSAKFWNLETFLSPATKNAQQMSADDPLAAVPAAIVPYKVSLHRRVLANFVANIHSVSRSYFQLRREFGADGNGLDPMKPRTGTRNQIDCVAPSAVPKCALAVRTSTELSMPESLEFVWNGVPGGCENEIHGANTRNIQLN